MAENIVESFTEYLECLTDDYQPHIIYRGEFIARYLYSSIEETNNWIVWENKDAKEARHPYRFRCHNGLVNQSHHLLRHAPQIQKSRLHARKREIGHSIYMWHKAHQRTSYRSGFEQHRFSKGIGTLWV